MSEVWLSGPIEDIDPLLMPAAHAFLQVRAEVPVLLDGLSTAQIWARPGASASMGFHAIHLGGATDRLMTYARGEQLSDAQLVAAREEKGVGDLDAAQIMARVNAAIDAALGQIRGTPATALTDSRLVGRQRLASTVLGIIFHAAEHATRHAGQMATLKRIVSVNT